MPKPVEEGEPCGKCTHPFDIHALIATTGDPLEGGIILCPVKDCECYATWGCAITGDKTSPPPKRIPDRFEIANLRESLQERHADNSLPPPKWMGLPMD